MKHRVLRIGLAGAGGALLAGCVTPDNDRAMLGQDVRLEALTPAPRRPAGPEVAVPVGRLTLEEPSVVGLDRLNWEPLFVSAPVDGVAHRTTYAKRVHIAGRTARHCGEHPNAETALELTGGSIWQQQLEVPANHGMAALDLLLILPRMVWTPPWRVRSSPDVAYERMWHPDRPIFPEAAETPLEDPFAEPAPHPVTP